MSMAQKKGLEHVVQNLYNIEIYNKDKTSSFTTPSFHISCRSDIFDGSKMVGIILYQYNGQTQWRSNNGIKCKSGYIYLCKSESLNDIQLTGPVRTAHAKCYKKLFDEEPDYTKITAGGFAYTQISKENTKKVWKYVSGTFSAPNQRKDRLAEHYKKPFADDWHNEKREMHDIERKWVKNCVNQWIQSDFTKQTLWVNPVRWSWYNGQWINYDDITQEYIETQYKLNRNHQKNKTCFVYLDCGEFKTNKKLMKQYRIFFSAPGISLDAKKIHSRKNQRWINDEDMRNKYFLQQNYKTKKYRIVRRRDMDA